MEVDKSLDSGEPYFHRDACNWNVQVFPASHCIYMMISLSPLALNHIQQQQQHSLFSQASWGRLIKSYIMVN